jgi:hypothetical protein
MARTKHFSRSHWPPLGWLPAWRRCPLPESVQPRPQLPASARVQLRLEELEKIDTTNLLALPGIGMFGIGLAGVASMPAVLGSRSAAEVRILPSFPGSAITGLRAGPAGEEKGNSATWHHSVDVSCQVTLFAIVPTVTRP